MTWMRAYALIRPWLLAIGAGLMTYGAVSNPHPVWIAVLAGWVVLIFHFAIDDVAEKIPKPKWPAIYITKEQLDDQPDLVAEHLRIVNRIWYNIQDLERLATAQFKMADDIDNDVWDGTLGKADVDEMPSQAYRAAARANQRHANYLGRTLNPEREMEA